MGTGDAVGMGSWANNRSYSSNDWDVRCGDYVANTQTLAKGRAPFCCRKRGLLAKLR